MKLLRFGPAGAERPGMLDARGRIRDLSAHLPRLDPDTLPGLDALRGIDAESLPLIEGSPRLSSPVGRVGKIIAIGLNYHDHCAECGYPVPSEPILFSKAVTSLCGPNDAVMLPKDSRKVDWEAELAIVIGRTARGVSEAEALHHVAGYAVCNDVTERWFQLEREGQWFKGKGCDTFCPLGPWLVTPDEVADPQRLRVWLELNGRIVQDSSTAQMVFGVAHLVSYCSRFMTLLPGDVITTGTPPGVGLGMDPPLYLKAGDVMRLGVEGLGEQRQVVVPFQAS